MDERVRRRAVERVRVASVFLVVCGVLCVPSTIGGALDFAGWSAAAAPFEAEMFVYAGVLGPAMVLVPAYLLWFPARAFGRANRNRWFAIGTGLLVAGMVSCVVLACVVMRRGLDGLSLPVQFGVVMFGPILVVASMAAMTLGLWRVWLRVRGLGLVVVLVCTALVAAGVGGVVMMLALVFMVEELNLFPMPSFVGLLETWMVMGMLLVPLEILVAGVASGVGAHRVVRQIIKETECPGCGYDTVGLSGRVCPECGAAVGDAGAGEGSPAPPLSEEAGGGE